MNIVIVLLLSTALTAKAQTVSKQATAVGKTHSIQSVQTGMNENGEIVMYASAMNGVQKVLTGDQVVKTLMKMAQGLCIGSPSSITVSAGVVSATWEKCMICKGILTECPK